MEVVGAIDQGTQSSRFFLYNSKGQVAGSHQVDLPNKHPRSGWVEQDPLEIWEGVQTCIAEALRKAEQKVGKLKVVAVGITNQRETTLLWDHSTGQPLHNAIVWLDTRTSDICSHFKSELGDSDYFRPVTGLPISTYFSAYKFKWLLDNVDGVAAAVELETCRFGTIDSWLLYQLTGGPDGGIHVTDVSNASRTNFMDLRTCAWHPPTLQRFGMRPALLPRIMSNVEIYGHVKGGPLAGVPIAGCLGDQMAAMLGQRCRRGEAKNTYGTGCFMLLSTGPTLVPSSHGLLSTIAYQLGPDAAPQYALEGSIAVAGAGVSWLRDQLGVIASAADSEAVAASVPDTAGVYFVPAFSGLLAPRWRDDARGAILGLSAYSGRGHVVRALLEGICFQTREVLDAMRADADLSHLTVLKVDGGACANDLLMQLQADLLQVPVERPHHMETTSLGAAFAAGMGVGFWTEAWVLQEDHDVQLSRTFQPAVSEEDAARRYACWKKAVELSYGLASLHAG